MRPKRFKTTSGDTLAGWELDIRILVDDMGPAGVPTARGFSALVDTPGPRILFDAGPDGELLLGALQREAVDPKSIDLVVISHAHPDHYGGLPRLLYDRPRLEVSVPAGAAPVLARKLPKASVIRGEQGPRDLAEGVRLTGDMGGAIPEQALLLESEEGWAAVVGCGHPGLEAIVAAADGDLSILVGGLHDLNPNQSMLSWVGRICACHCTPNKRVLSHRLDNVELGAVGTVIHVPTA